MKNRNLLVSFLFTFLLISSCEKENNHKWIIGDVKVRSAYTLLPVDATFDLWYRYKDEQYEEDEFEILELGSSENGEFHIEQKFKHKLNEAYLAVYGHDFYNVPGEKTLSYFYNELSITRVNEIEIDLAPVYHVNTSILNTSCFDATDTLKIGVMDPAEDVMLHYVYTGCFDGPGVDLPKWSKNDYVEYHVVTIKNGVESDLEVLYFDLLIEQVNQVLVEY